MTLQSPIPIFVLEVIFGRSSATTVNYSASAE